MPHRVPSLALIALTLLASAAAAQEAAPAAPAPPAPPIGTMSALAFAPDGTLFVGDAKSAAVFAVDLGERARRVGGR